MVVKTKQAGQSYPVQFATFEGEPVTFNAQGFDKVNALVGAKGTGKSHAAKLILHRLTGLGAPCMAFDINREFVDLPRADVIRIGDTYKLRLDEVGFPFLMALIDDLGPMTDVARGAFEHAGPKFIEQEVKRTGGATMKFLLDRATSGQFHSNDMVNIAIETRIRMVIREAVFDDDPKAESLTARFDRITKADGFMVFDLAELSPRRLRAITRGLLRRLEAICDRERRSGRGRYPFVFFEEAHFYAAPDEILNLITRGRHLGLTTFFITNTPRELPEVVFRQVDNMIVTGLTHSTDLKTIAKSSLSDEDTLESLATGLGATQALIVGRITNNFPLVCEIDPLPATFPATGVTRSFWK